MIAVAPLIVAILRARSRDSAAATATRRSSAAAARHAWQGFVLGYLCGILWFAEPAIGSSTPCTAMVAADSSRDAGAGFVLYVRGLYHGMFGLLLALVADHPR